MYKPRDYKINPIWLLIIIIPVFIGAYWLRGYHDSKPINYRAKWFSCAIKVNGLERDIDVLKEQSEAQERTRQIMSRQIVTTISNNPLPKGDGFSE